MSRSKKDFVGIAKRLAAVRPIRPHDDMNPDQKNYQRGAFTYWEQACKAVALHCQEVNSNFNLNKFLEACND